MPQQRTCNHIFKIRVRRGSVHDCLDTCNEHGGGTLGLCFSLNKQLHQAACPFVRPSVPLALTFALALAMVPVTHGPDRDSDSGLGLAAVETGEIYNNSKVLRMVWPIMERLRGLNGNNLNLFRIP